MPRRDWRRASQRRVCSSAAEIPRRSTLFGGTRNFAPPTSSRSYAAHAPAGELSSRRGDRFEDYTEAIKNLLRDPKFSPELVAKLERLPGFRNVVIHEYVALDLERVVAALNELDPMERSVEVVAGIEASA